MSHHTTTLPVAEAWFETSPLEGGITLISEPHVDELLRANMFLVRDRDENLLIDAGLGVANLHAALSHLFDVPTTVVVTHAHQDHQGGAHEFASCLAHPLEVEGLADPDPLTLRQSAFSTTLIARLRDAGYEVQDVLVNALPAPDFDLDTCTPAPVTPTGLLTHGDTVTVGSRTFRVLHLPGHSPGQIGLFEEATGILFSADALYDGPLLDFLPGSSIPSYIDTIRMLRALPVSVLYGGHGPSVGRARMVTLCDQYLSSRGRGAPTSN